MWYKKRALDDLFLREAVYLYNFRKLKGSITKGKSQIYGAAGEILVKHFYEKTNNVIHHGTHDYDMIINGYTIEVKTKARTDEPYLHYNGSVCCLNAKQNCDFYFFCQISKNYKFGYLLGYVSREEFMKESFLLKKGEKDGQFTVREDCLNMKYADMRRVK